jgi:energy-converting hydrogenase Eha subunit A
MTELLAVSMVSVYLVAMVSAIVATQILRFQVRRNMTLRQS